MPNWLCAPCFYWVQCESHCPCLSSLRGAVKLRILPHRAVAAGLARVVIYQSQLAGKLRLLPLLVVGPVLTQIVSQTASRFRKASVRPLRHTLSQHLLYLLVLITTWIYWSMIELGLSITAACLPTLRPLLQGSSVQGWYKGLQSYLKVLSKSSSTRPKKLSTFDAGPSTDPHKDLEQHSNSSQVGILPSNVAQITTNIYPLHDLEAQKNVSGGGITVRSKIEQASSVQ